MKTCSNFVISHSDITVPLCSLVHPLNFPRHCRPSGWSQLMFAKGWLAFLGQAGTIFLKELGRARRLLCMVCHHFSCFIVPPLPQAKLPVIALQNNSLSTQPLVSQGVYFNPAETAEILLPAKLLKNSEAITPLRNEGKICITLDGFLY